MILCVDIGNTNIVIGLFENETSKVSNKWRIHTDANLTSDEYGIKIAQMMSFANLKIEDISGVIISSVVPQLDSMLAIMVEKYFKKSAIFVGPGLKSGIKIKLDNPKQLGADLLVGAVAAVNKYDTPVIVIDMGTATTLTAVNDKKELLGVVIMPGIKTAYSGLFQKASKLEHVKVAAPSSVIGRDTVTSIQSGMVFGMASMIDGMIRKIKKESGEAKVVITGGEARYILPLLEEKVIFDDDLLLDGLRYLYYKNQI